MEKFKDFCSGICAKVKKAAVTAYEKAKQFINANPVFAGAATVLLVAGLLNHNIGALLIFAAIITSITMFWVHCFNLIATTMGDFNAKAA